MERFMPVRVANWAWVSFLDLRVRVTVSERRARDSWFMIL